MQNVKREGGGERGSEYVYIHEQCDVQYAHTLKNSARNLNGMYV